MDARANQRAWGWTNLVLRNSLRRPSRSWTAIRTAFVAAIIVAHCAAPGYAAWPTWGRKAATTDAAATSEIRRLPPPPATSYDQQASAHSQLASGPILPLEASQPADVDSPAIVPWRIPSAEQTPPPHLLSGALAARLQQGATYDGPVVSPAEPLPAPGGTRLPTIPDAVPLLPEEPAPEFERPGYFARWFGPGIYAGGELLSNVPFDYKNFYSLRSLAWLGGGVGIAAILGNTAADQNFESWYNGKLKGQTSDSLTADVSWLGHGQIMVPVFIAAGLVLTPFEERWPLARGVGQWGRRTTRGFIVGAPMLIVLQYAIGSDRPRLDTNSHWHPFKSTHGASGDAFIAGIVLMSAAKEVDNPLAKGALYVASVLPAVGRINDDAHYLSQAFLGVWLAAVTVSAVDRTDRMTSTFIVPYAEHGAVGGRVGWRW